MGLSEVKKRQDFWNNSAPLASCKIQLARGAELFQKVFFGHNFFERTEFVLQYQKSKKVGNLPIEPPVSSSSWLLLQRHPGGNAKASHGEATYSQVPRDGRRPSVHDLPCEASRSAKMGEGRSDRNLYAHVGAARRRNQGGDRGSAPTLGSK